MAKQDTEKFSTVGLILGLICLAMNIYYTTYGLWLGLRPDPQSELYAVSQQVFGFIDNLLDSSKEIFENPYMTKLWSLLIIFVSLMVKVGKGTEKSWSDIIAYITCGLILYFIPAQKVSGMAYVGCTVIGVILCIIGFNLAVRKTKSFKKEKNDIEETFEQCDDLIESDVSINFKTIYKYQGKYHTGHVNVVSPPRGTIILGVPGSGKSYVIYGEFFRQMIKHGFTGYCYDFKYPDLTQDLYNIVMMNQDVYREKYGREAQFRVINFDDIRYTNRCNPLAPKYLVEDSDIQEAAHVIMDNLNKGKNPNSKEFFDLSACILLVCVLSLLKIYKEGRYCTLPHAIVLLASDFKRLFKILSNEPRIAIPMASFNDAMNEDAQEQLQGQIASLRIPLAQFNSANLWYVLTGDEIDLDLNNKEHPTILCAGNNPDRASLYSTSHALFTARIYKALNHPERAMSFVALDEFPTIYQKGIDNVIATARSNGVCTILGAQDKGQIERDYSKEEAKVIFNTCTNIFSGAVQGETAKDFNQMFGRENREQHSQTQSNDSESVSLSYHEKDRLPIQMINNLSVGHFFGKVGDDIKHPIKNKDFCAKFIINDKQRAEEKKKFKKLPPIRSKEFGEDKIRDELLANDGAKIKENWKKENSLTFRLKLEKDCIMQNKPPYGTEFEDELNNKLEKAFANMGKEKLVKVFEDQITKALNENAKLIAELQYNQVIADVNDLLNDLDPDGMVA